ncbi:hypothetical protein NQ317_009558 [Molorchus minor]|uniref:Uncharacterized protein n=1 Tax=Molorchus minor TaxID=1323400 RepID=A0ABQ9JGQ8_9CUCU|nr:hypothetical protein NQ317_009558 [Molorchus minor]
MCGIRPGGVCTPLAGQHAFPLALGNHIFLRFAVPDGDWVQQVPGVWSAIFLLPTTLPITFFHRTSSFAGNRDKPFFTLKTHHLPLPDLRSPVLSVFSLQVTTFCNKKENHLFGSSSLVGVKASSYKSGLPNFFNSASHQFKFNVHFQYETIRPRSGLPWYGLMRSTRPPAVSSTKPRSSGQQGKSWS